MLRRCRLAGGRADGLQSRRVGDLADGSAAGVGGWAGEVVGAVFLADTREGGLLGPHARTMYAGAGTERAGGVQVCAV